MHGPHEAEAGPFRAVCAHVTDRGGVRGTAAKFREEGQLKAIADALDTMHARDDHRESSALGGDRLFTCGFVEATATGKLVAS